MVESNVELERPLNASRNLNVIFRTLFSRGVGIFGLVIIFLLILTAIFAPLIAPYDPYKTNLRESMQAPSAQPPGSAPMKWVEIC